MKLHVDILVMSGVNDGEIYEFELDSSDNAQIMLGRDADNDITITTDVTISRHHATIHYAEGAWWLEDRDSKNGTFVEHTSELGRDIPVHGTILLQAGQLFRTGKTWFRFQPHEWGAFAG